MHNFPRRFSGLRTKTTTRSRATPDIHPSASRGSGGCGQFVSASIIVPSLSRMARTSFGFGLVITASMTESLLDAADDSNEAPKLSLHLGNGRSAELRRLGNTQRNFDACRLWENPCARLI